RPPIPLKWNVCCASMPAPEKWYGNIPIRARTILAIRQDHVLLQQLPMGASTLSVRWETCAVYARKMEHWFGSTIFLGIISRLSHRYGVGRLTLCSMATG